VIYIRFVTELRQIGCTPRDCHTKKAGLIRSSSLLASGSQITTSYFRGATIITRKIAMLTPFVESLSAGLRSAAAVVKI
jgi:hypothetical protein